MKKVTKLFSAFVCAGLCSVLAFGQEKAADEQKKSEPEVMTLTLEEAVKYGLENSRTLKSAAIDLEMKKRADTFSWNTLLPSAQMSGTLARSNNADSIRSSVKQVMALSSSTPGVYSSLTDSMADSAIESSFGSVEAAQWHPTAALTFSWNFNAAMIDSMIITRKNYESGKISWEKSCNETELSIRKLFYGILMLQDSLKIDEESLSNAEARWKQAEINYKNGQVPELSVLNARVTYQNKKPNVEWSRQSLEQQKDLFAFLLGLPYGTKIKLTGSIDDDYQKIVSSIGDFTADELFQKYINQNLDVMSTKKSIETLDKGIEAQYFSTFTPSLAISWGLSPVVSNITKDWFEKGNSSEGGSLSFTLVYSNLLNMLPFSSNMQKIKDSKQQMAQAQIGLETLYQNTEMTIHNSVDDLNKSRDNIQSMMRNIEVAESAYKSTLRGYNNGSQEELAVRDAENSLNQAKLGLTSEKLTYINNVLTLENTLNTKLVK